MIFVLSIAAIFVALSIYFYFRAEGLQRELFSVKKELSSSQKENKFYIDSMAIIAKRHEDFVNNYASIFIECLKGKGKLQSITKKCYGNFDDGAFKRFVAHVAKQDASVRRMWSSNNLTGYISLIEALLLTKTKKDA